MQALEKCYFCKSTWGKCQCKALPDGFEHDGTHITEPNVTECGRFFVDPFEYYGVDYTNYLKLGEQHGD